MHFDWTFNVENLLMLGSILVTGVSLFLKMHERLLKVEIWIEHEGERAEKALNVLETMGDALTKVSVLYEQHEKRMDRMQSHCDRQHNG